MCLRVGWFGFCVCVLGVCFGRRQVGLSVALCCLSSHQQLSAISRWSLSRVQSSKQTLFFVIPPLLLQSQRGVSSAGVRFYESVCFSFGLLSFYRMRALAHLLSLSSNHVLERPARRLEEGDCHRAAAGGGK